MQGVVTRAQGDGFYLESPLPAPDRHSRAIFISPAQDGTAVHPGQQLQLSGQVAETGSGRDTMTSLSEAADITFCADASTLPVTQVALPMKPGAREALEGMRLVFDQRFTLTNPITFSQGKAMLSAGDRLWAPTEIADPGEPALGIDQANRNRTLYTRLPEAAPEDAPAAAMPVGTGLQGIVGVMGHDGRYSQLMLESMPEILPGAPPSLPAAPPGGLRVVSSNLQNFFNGDGQGGGFPTERGARTAAQFERQKQRMAAAFAQMKPDLLGVQELENNGFGPYSAAEELRQLLSASTGNPFGMVSTENGRVGDDVIAVGLFFNQNALEAVGPAQVLGGSPFIELSRQPLAQLFRDRNSGTVFLAVANHLKSKGSCPGNGENANQDDGQGCWNPARVAAIHAQLPWLEGLAKAAGTRHIVILGDLNAQRREDPVRALEQAGFLDITHKRSALPPYSFVYQGQAGTLDYVFVTPELAAAAHQATNWHISADWAEDTALPEPWMGMSDHDPVVVDFVFSQERTAD